MSHFHNSSITPIIFTRIAQLQPILEFCTNLISEAIALASVSRTFREALQFYCHLLWMNVVRRIREVAKKKDEEDGHQSSYLLCVMPFHRLFRTTHLLWVIRALGTQGEMKFDFLTAAAEDEDDDELFTVATPSPLCHAVRASKGLSLAPVVDVLIDDLHVSPETPDFRGDPKATATTFTRRPLMYAIMKNNVQMVQYLIKKGAEVNTGNEQSVTSYLSWAAANERNYALVKILLDAGAKVDVTTSETTPLQKLVQDVAVPTLSVPDEEDSPTFRILKLLLERGADVNGRKTDGTGTGKNPILTSIAGGNYPVTKLLQKHGANFRQLHRTRNALMMIAQASYDDKIQVALLELLLGEDCFPMEQETTTRDDADDTSHDATPTAASASASPAAASSSSSAQQLLVARRQQFVNEQDRLGNTALMYACKNDKLEAAKVLLSTGGADIAIRNNNNETASLLATQRVLNVIYRHVRGTLEVPELRTVEGEKKS